MINYSTLVEALEANRVHGQGVTYIEGEENERRISFASLYDRALGILHHFQRRGLTPGSELILSLNGNEQFVDAFWACLLGKIVPVPLAVGISDEHRHKLFSIFARLSAPYLYTSRKNLGRLASFAETHALGDEFAQLKSRTILVDHIDDISTKGSRYAPQPDDVAFIQFSSGSTSEPKGVVLSHHNLLVNIKAIIESGAMTQEDSFLSWMPLTHDMGLIGFHLTPLVRNVDHHLMPTDLFIRRPLLWLLKASEKRATILCSPNFGYRHFLKLFDAGKGQNLDLSHARLMFNGAEPISVSLCEEFLSEMAAYGLERTAMFPVYGLAEASLAVTFPEVGAALKTYKVDRDSLGLGDAVRFADDGRAALEFVGVGRPIRNCRVRIADTDDAPLTEDIIGRIQIKGENITRGYYNDPASSEAVFSADGWLDTGDLGFISAGELVVTGRAKDIIFVNGQNYFPHDLEAIARHVAPLELGKVAVCGARPDASPTDEIIVFVLFRGTLEKFMPIAKAVKKHINEEAGVDVAHVIPVGRIPKTTSGKIQRYLLADGYLRGEFAETTAALEKALAESHAGDSVTRTEIERKLKEICDGVIPEAGIGVHENIFEAGTSSLALAQIHERIDQTYPGMLDITDFFDYPTIAELSHYLEAKRRGTLAV